MKRSLLRLVVAAVMMTMVLAMAAQAFAVPSIDAGGTGGCDEFGNCGGGGGMTSLEGSALEPCNPEEQTCSGTTTTSGGGGGHGPDVPGGSSGFGSHQTASSTTDFTDDSNPIVDDVYTSAGGGSEFGGGRCTIEGSFGTEPVVDGVGPRC